MERRIHFHDLRHTFASNYLNYGGDIYVLKEMLGHSTVSMTERYSHLCQNRMAEEIKRVNFGGESITSPEIARDA